jgi:HK97 family phage prohead protease
VSDRFNQRAAFEVASFKAADANRGDFEALVSVFGNVDYGGDRVLKGAFGKSLARWNEKGDPIPVIWNHMWENPEAHIGKVNPGDAVEVDDGLLVKGTLDMDNPFAAQVYRLLSERRVKEFSFGYNLVDSKKAKDGALDLTEIDLFEVGPTLKGMNPATELLAVKALAEATEATVTDGIAIFRPSLFVEAKAGARHSKATRDLIQQHIDALHAHFLSDDTSSENPPKAVEAEAMSKASDPVADIQTRIRILMED